MSSPATLLAAFLERVEDQRPAVLSRHGPNALCCSAAIAWLRAMTGAGRHVSEAPEWIAARWGWGPTRWPIHWCEAVRSEVLDCGALAELAFEAFRDGPDVPLKVQLVQQKAPIQLAHWKALWEREGADGSWIREPFVYHEVVGVLRGSVLDIWDPADGLWKESGQGGHGGIVAIRPVLPRCASSPACPVLMWDRWILRPNHWNQVSAGSMTARSRGTIMPSTG